MAELLGKMRWFPGDALIPIRQNQLDEIGAKHRVHLSMSEVTGQNQKVLPGGVVVEWNWEKPIDEATQTIVTIKAENEQSFRRCVRELIDTYRGPVPMWGMWGSTKQAEDIINELLDQDDCWS